MFTSFLLMAVKKGPYARGARRTRDARLARKTAKTSALLSVASLERETNARRDASFGRALT